MEIAFNILVLWSSEFQSSFCFESGISTFPILFFSFQGEEVGID